MKKFLALYMMPIGAMDEMMKTWTPEQRQAGMDEWKKWGQAHKADLVEMGAALGRNKRVSASGIEDVRNEMGGYSVVQAESHETAAAVLRDSPHLKIPNCYVDLMECIEM